MVPRQPCIMLLLMHDSWKFWLQTYEFYDQILEKLSLLFWLFQWQNEAMFDQGHIVFFFYWCMPLQSFRYSTAWVKFISHIYMAFWWLNFT